MVRIFILIIPCMIRFSFSGLAQCPGSTKTKFAYIEVDWSNCKGPEQVIGFPTGNVSVTGQFYKLPLPVAVDAASFKDIPALDGFEFKPYRNTTPKPAFIDNKCVIHQKFVAYPIVTIRIEAEPSGLRIPFAWGDGAKGTTTSQIPNVSISNDLILTFTLSAKGHIINDKIDFARLLRETRIRLSKSDCVDRIIESQPHSQIAPRFLKMLKENLSNEIKADAIIYSAVQ